MGFFFQKHLMFCSLWSTFFGPQNLSTIVLVVLTTANFGGSVISAGTVHDLRRVKVPGTGPLWNPWIAISFHPCVKLGPEQSWHHFKIKKWPITNYVQTQFSVISSNLSMIIMYYEYMTTQYFGRFFLSI
jgi:hypothetical protein